MEMIFLFFIFLYLPTFGIAVVWEKAQCAREELFAPGKKNSTAKQRHFPVGYHPSSLRRARTATASRVHSFSPQLSLRLISISSPVGAMIQKGRKKTPPARGTLAKRWQKPRRKNAMGAHTYAFGRSIALQSDYIPNCDTQRSTFPSEKIKNRASGWNTRGENSHRRPFEL